jgi:hypothetical protein
VASQIISNPPREVGWSASREKSCKLKWEARITATRPYTSFTVFRELLDVEGKRSCVSERSARSRNGHKAAADRRPRITSTAASVAIATSATGDH